MGLVVQRTGPLAVVEDRGRPGHAHLGVPPSGALDGPALALANRLVGNEPAAAGLELLLGGTVLRTTAPCQVAVTGPPVEVRVDGRATCSHRACYLPAGATLSIGTPASGLRSYLAVSGGIDIEPVLGSRSTDLLSGLGPPELTAGDELPVGRPHGPAPPDGAVVPLSVLPDEVVVTMRLGPRDGWFADPAAALRDPVWTVSSTSNRIGVRLEGPAPARHPARGRGELPSEPLITGAVQVPPDGPPVIFLADHPTTGGYPVLGVVDPADLPRLAQARPGSTVRFTVR